MFDKKFKRIWSFLLVICLLIPLFPVETVVAVDTSGSCGPNVTWSFDEATGTLTISGTGEMTSYLSPSPWQSICTSIKTAVIENGITKVGWYAFNGCSNLTSISIASSVNDLGWYTFKDCSSLISVEIPNGVTEIGQCVFEGCSSLTNVNIPDGVTKIGWAAFEGCSSLISIGIPRSVTSIGVHAFASCDALTDVYITDLNAWINISIINVLGNPLYTGGNLYLNEELITELVIPEGITQIKDYTFAGCDSISAIDFPESLVSIGVGSFQNCNKLAQIVIPDQVTSIGSKAFYSCGSLDSVKLPNSITSIHDAFAVCWQLTSINIPENVTSLDQFSFGSCGKLASITIPNNVKSISNKAFSYCDKLSAVYFLGNAPSVVAAAEKEPSFPTGVTLYYIPGTAGWTDSPAYDAATNTWNGYQLDTWEPDFLKIRPLSDNKIALNGHGYGWALYQLTDYAGKPIRETNVSWTLGTASGGQAVTDGNGVFSIRVPETSVSETVQVEFSLPWDEKELYGSAQTIHVTVHPLSFVQEWKGVINGSLGAGVSFGPGVEIPAVKAEATLFKMTEARKASGEISVKHELDNGVRTMELNYGTGLGHGLKFKTGIDATVAKVDVNVIGASAGVSTMSQQSYGLKLPAYDPDDPDHAASIGAFLLQCSLSGSQSVLARSILDILDVSAHNQSGHEQSITASAGASLGSLEYKTPSGTKAEIAIAGIDADVVMSYSVSEDHLESFSSYASQIKAELGAGLGKGLSFTAEDSVESSFGDYLYGNSDSNSMKIQAEFDGSGALNGMSYTIYDGKESNISWATESKDIYSTVSFDKDASTRIAASNENLQNFVDGRDAMLAPVRLFLAQAAMYEAKESGTVKEIKKLKKGVDYELPFSISLEIALDAALGLSVEESISSSVRSGVLVDGQSYETAVSTVTDAELKGKGYELKTLLAEPIKTISNSINGWFSKTWGTIKDTVSNGFVKIEGAATEWYAEIANTWDNTFNSVGLHSESYAVLAVEAEDVADSDAAVAVTIGNPYSVTIYTDETQTSMVPEDELLTVPLTVTLQYTQEMLDAAGAPDNCALNIYWFDAERNLYVCQESVQNREEMSVSAPITHHGEYILATDNASPLISDFALSDQTATPMMSVLISDLSGIETLSFWLDNGQVLVSEQNLDEYYDSTTGVFTYTCTSALSTGAHTAYFQATDHLGNANLEPFAFPFTVDAEKPVITAVQIPDTVTEDQVPVTVQVRDNDRLANVMVKAVSSEKVISVPMTEQNGFWYAEITGVAGFDDMQVSIVAVDYAGNRSESAFQTVTVQVPAAITGVIFQTSYTDGSAQVSVTNHNRRAISGWLICAAYDADGKMLDIGSTWLGMSAMEANTYQINISCEQPVEVKAFLLDVSHGYIPVT